MTLRNIGLMSFFALAGCGTQPLSTYDAARYVEVTGETADRIRATWKVELWGPWDDVELEELEQVLEMYPGKDISGIQFYRLVPQEERGARYDKGRVGVYEVNPDVLIHEMAHATHDLSYARDEVTAKVEALLDFRLYSSVATWKDGSRRPRKGFVTPYAAHDAYECVAESITAAKLFAWFGRGPLTKVDWSDERFVELFRILADRSLIGEREERAIANLKRRH